jgi:hypothetical protein
MRFGFFIIDIIQRLKGAAVAHQNPPFPHLDLFQQYITNLEIISSENPPK